jgi:hypothetical protein
MGRVFLTIIIPLLLPTALYVAWRLAVGRGLNLPASWIWLVVAGLMLASLTLVAVSVDFGGTRQGIYVPPHVSNGEVVPGHIEPALPQSPAPPPP